MSKQSKVRLRFLVKELRAGRIRHQSRPKPRIPGKLTLRHA